MSTAYITHAICLRTWNTSDSSKVGVWLSPTHGAIRAMARGVRGKTRTLAGACYPLMVNQIQFVAKANLHQVSQCRSVEGFSGLQHDLLANALATCLLAAAETLAGPVSNHHASHSTDDDLNGAELYEPLYQGLYALNQLALNTPEGNECNLPEALAITLSSLLQLSNHSGHAPQWTECIHTQQPLPENADPIAFMMHDGGVTLLPSEETQGSGLRVNLTRPTWQVLQAPSVAGISQYPQPAKLLSFYQHYLAHLAEKRQPLPAFTFALQLLEQPLVPAATVTAESQANSPAESRAESLVH